VVVMGLAYRTVHPKEQLIFKMKEHVDLYFHTLSHFIIHDCKENIFSFDYFSLISSLKKKLDLNPMNLVMSLDGLYECYQKEKSLLNIQFLPFCTDSTDGLFRIMDTSNNTGMDTLGRDLRIEVSGSDVRRFFKNFRQIILEEYYSFFKDSREKIQRSMIDKDALWELSELCTGRGADILSVLHSILNKRIYVYLCPSLTKHARMIERNSDIFIAIGDLSTRGAVVPRFLNIIHEASHRIVDGLAVKTYLRRLSRVFSEKTEKIHLIKEISVIYFNKKLISKYTPEFTGYFERVYNLEKLIKLFFKKTVRFKGFTNLHEQFFPAFDEGLKDLFEA
jgi:hypothetical protein